MNHDLQPGDLVRSNATIWNPATGKKRKPSVGLIMKVREGAFVNQPLAQVYWPHSRTFGWVEAKDMEVVSEDR